MGPQNNYKNGARIFGGQLGASPVSGVGVRTRRVSQRRLLDEGEGPHLLASGPVESLPLIVYGLSGSL